MDDRSLLIRDKYDGIDPGEALEIDLARLACGEPLAYVIGWIPFLELRISLDSHPLIPRPETEWWTNELITHLHDRFREYPFTFLDLCAGSGAIGLVILKEFPNARVTFAELMPDHVAQIKKNLEENELDRTRADIRESDLFDAFASDDVTFDIIASNPPYIPEERTLDASVADHEPLEALFGGAHGLALISRIAQSAREHIVPGGELWMECDIENVGTSKTLLETEGAIRAELRTDQYGRPRFVVSYW